MFKPLARFVGGVMTELLGQAEVGRAPARRARPRLEELGARIVPAVYYWAPQGGSAAWGTASNWIESYQRASQAPGASDDVIFANGASLLEEGVYTAVYTNYACTYTGSGGAIAKSITIQAGYTQTVTLDALSIDLDKLDQRAGTVYLSADGATLETDEWEWQGGNMGADAGEYVSVKVKAQGSFNWKGNVDRETGVNVFTELGAQGLIEFTNNTNTVEFKNNASLHNYGSIQHKKGDIIVASGSHNTYAGYLNNRGAYTVNPGTGNTIKIHLPIENGEGSTLKLQGDLTLWSAGNRDAAFKQTDGELLLLNGAQFVSVESRAGKNKFLMSGGELRTLDDTLCRIFFDGRAELSGGAVRLDAVNNTGKGQLKFRSDLYLSGTVHLYFNLNATTGAKTNDKITADNIHLGNITTDTNAITVTKIAGTPATTDLFDLIVADTNCTMDGWFAGETLPTGARSRLLNNQSYTVDFPA